MKKQTVKYKSFVFIAIAIFLGGCSPVLKDISPERFNYVSDGGLSTAGLMLNLAGDKNGLYAIGLNSGVWKNQVDRFGLIASKWQQLPQSPRYAHCIAVDPNQAEHIIVGEREGDGSVIADNNCGLWESYDAGVTFKHANYYNPLSHPCGIPDLQSQVVNAVAITDKSTSLISTPCGLGRKEYFETAFTFLPEVSDKSFTAVATFKEWIVARTADEIFISNTDGKSWVHFDIQYDFPTQAFDPTYEPQRSGTYSAAIIVEPKTGNVFVYLPAKLKLNPIVNWCGYLIFDYNASQWRYQGITERGLGVAVGGRSFVKSFFSYNNNLDPAIGGNTNLVYCSAQNLFVAESIDSRGLVTWKNFANVEMNGESSPSGIHSDIWDFLIDPGGHYSWVSCDGGVYFHQEKTVTGRIDLNLQQQYLNLNYGLNTQHIHSVFLPDLPLRNTRNGVQKEYYLYGTQDNGAWRKGLEFFNVVVSPLGLGDVNMVTGDEGSGFAIAATNLKTAAFNQLGEEIIGTKNGFPVINNNMYLSSFQFIPSLASETPVPLPDAVMLTILPLETKGVFTFLGGNEKDTVIIRNSTFAFNPDVTAAALPAWSIEFNDLPENTHGLWMGGGHKDPYYYIMTEENPGASGSHVIGGSIGNIFLHPPKRILYRRKKNDPGWVPLTDPAQFTIMPCILGHDKDGFPSQMQNGPVFVNPYRDNDIYIACTDGIYHSVFPRRGTFHFEKDVELTNLISGNGKYPLDMDFAGGKSDYVVHSTHANPMCPLSSMGFSRQHPQQIVASSPFTGVFYKNGTKKWRDLSGVLPKPFTPVSSVHINSRGIYVTTEGRGLFLITNF